MSGFWGGFGDEGFGDEGSGDGIFGWDGRAFLAGYFLWGWLFLAGRADEARGRNGPHLAVGRKSPAEARNHYWLLLCSDLGTCRRPSPSCLGPPGSEPKLVQAKGMYLPIQGAVRLCNTRAKPRNRPTYDIVFP